MSQRKRKNSNTSWVLLFGSFICSLCCIGIIFFNLITSDPIVANPQTTFSTNIPIETMIVQTVSGAQTQTALVSNPTPIPTQILASTISVESTETIFIFELQTNVAQQTEYIFSTNTPFIYDIPSPSSNGGGVCSCSSDSLSCSNFSSRAGAQACFNYCISVGAGDIHKLDGNNDGVTCESLP